VVEPLPGVNATLQRPAVVACGSPRGLKSGKKVRFGKNYERKAKSKSDKNKVFHKKRIAFKQKYYKLCRVNRFLSPK
jgi:hypothetical protein